MYPNYSNDRKNLGYEVINDTNCGIKLVIITDLPVKFIIITFKCKTHPLKE